MNLGACEVCGSRAAVASCRLCGRLYCGLHGSGGRCVACSSALCSLCGSRLSVGYCPSCGRLVCTECSIQLDPVRRVCRECGSPGYRRIYERLTGLKASTIAALARRELADSGQES